MWAACATLWLATGNAAAVPAEEWRVEATKLAAPAELSAALRETLGEEAARILGPKGAVCEIWLRKVLPVKAGAGPELGVAYPELPEGTFVGAVRVLEEIRDYRRQRINPGVYTLRYALHPTDGNHMGIAEHRDFLILVPAPDDTNLTPIPFDDLMKRSRKTVSANHPAAWSLQEGEAAAPGAGFALTHEEEHDLWVLHYNVQWQAGSGAPSAKRMTVVVLGFAPEA
jgi:hypothetical protein